MASYDGPNPYRPYHVPPSHIPPTLSATTSASVNSSATRSTPKFDLGASARDALSDLDYSDYLSDASPSVLEVLKKLIDQGLWKYTSILLAQPFEVAKIILQVQDAGYVTDLVVKPEREQSHRVHEDAYDSDDDDDTQSYFTSSAPVQTTRSRREYHQRRRYSSSRSRSRHSETSRRSHTSTQQQNIHTKALTSTSSLTAVLSSLWSTEGAWGVWKGTNSTFWHSVLLSTITSFLRSFFCAIFALPDPTIAFTALPSPSALARLDIISSPSPITSLILSVSASGLAGLLLSPLDIARTKLIATPSSHPPRSIISAVSSLGSWSISTSIAHLTVLHSTLPTLITAATPLFIRSRLGLDSATTPSSYAFVTFLSQAFELSVRLPIETSLRRGQLQIAKGVSEKHAARSIYTRNAETAMEMQTTVPIGAYKGLWGTWYHIAYEEGSRPTKPSAAAAASTLKRASGVSSSRDSSLRPSAVVEGKRRKGQGISGLYRGWRVGAWGLVGMWTAHFVGGGGGGSGAGTGSGGF